MLYCYLIIRSNKGKTEEVTQDGVRTYIACLQLLQVGRQAVLSFRCIINCMGVRSLGFHETAKNNVNVIVLSAELILRYAFSELAD